MAAFDEYPSIDGVGLAVAGLLLGTLSAAKGEIILWRLQPGIHPSINGLGLHVSDLSLEYAVTFLCHRCTPVPFNLYLLLPYSPALLSHTWLTQMPIFLFAHLCISPAPIIIVPVAST